jgi:amino-acid N-acetyltransferase
MAAETDIDGIFELLELYVPAGIVLQRSKEDIAQYLGNFRVALCDEKIVGCAAARDFGNDMLEVRSLVVHPDHQGKGVGKAIVKQIIDSLQSTRKNWKLFALTMRPEFFCNLGFREVPKALFPEKIWSDCSKCAKRHCCDEIAVLMDSEDINNG